MNPIIPTGTQKEINELFEADIQKISGIPIGVFIYHCKYLY